MRLADRMGKLDLVSTPNGRNWFYRKMKALKDRPKKAYVQSGDSRENRFISKEYLKMQIEYLSDKRVAQNIMGVFVDSGGEIIPGRYVDDALIAGITGNKAVKRDTEDRQRLCLSGWDLARKKTATVGITIEVVDDIDHR